ncbi:MAG TPA: hypothetical protein VFI15_11520, partial [Candidatus Limnocylindrales bacterium]|nr:hypothetical protein [Candidatus Limnocylindrales bacterium]
LCVAQRQDFCARTFVVDRIAELGGQALDVQTHRVDSAAATDLEADVDALVRGVAPGAVIQSRALIPISTLLELEPILIHDLVIPNVANQETRVWLVTVTDLRSGVPVARTFALIDGSSWFAEITADGARLLDRAAIAPAISATPVLPPAPEDAFRDAPREVAGIRVTTIGVAMQERQAVMGNLGRDEFAIEAWYIAPNPAATCAPALPALHAPLPLCDEARHWLLDDPQQYGVEPGQLRRDPSEDLWPPVLNPIVPIDVPLDILGAWDGGVPRPLAVIVLGHFDDVRVDTYAGNVYFVIDALVWTPRQGPDGSTPIVRLAQDATEDPSAVLARVARLYPTPAALTWVTVVDAKDFASLDRRAVSMPEFSTGAPVWIVRSLVPSEMDGRQRMAVQWAWTADHGTRVWWTPTPDSQPDLATTIDLPNLGSHTSLLRLYDYAAQITKASATAGSYAWHEIGPIPDLIDVARGGNDHQVAIRWKGVSCDTEWRLEINAYQGQTVIQPRRIGASDCESGLVTRTVLIEFDHPIDIDTFRTGDPCCG